VQSGGTTVQAIAGNHAVFLGFDLSEDARRGCLGFALHRVDRTENESYFLSGFKTFRSVVPQPSATVIYPSDKHPIQGMWWGDYSAKPAHDYEYTAVPMYGSPKNLTSSDANSVKVDVTTSSLTAKELWTGSTNLSQGGIFGHSNVGHAVRDATVAGAYLEYWTELSADPAGRPLKQWVTAHSPFAAQDLAGAGIHALFSPRTALDPLDWYAQRFTAADAGSTHLTLPFGMDNKHFEPMVTAIPASDATLRFVMLDLADDHQATWSANHAVQVAVGSEGGPDALSRWAKETLTGFNAHVPYLHTKILLASPLAAVPIVISGSANFSAASTTSNDENMLIVAGDPDVADVYFTEYARIFQHFYARWWAAHLDPHGSDTHSFLTEDDSWQQRYFDPKSPKYAERLLYSSQVQANAP
jgi:hypothetical protein